MKKKKAVNAVVAVAAVTINVAGKDLKKAVQIT